MPAPKRSDLELNADALFEMDLTPYVGQWVILVGGNLVATGPDPAPLLRRVRRQHPGRVPFIYQVPGPYDIFACS